MTMVMVAVNSLVSFDLTRFLAFVFPNTDILEEPEPNES